MKRMKKIIALLLAALLSVTLIACGSEEDREKKSSRKDRTEDAEEEDDEEYDDEEYDDEDYDDEEEDDDEDLTDDDDNMLFIQAARAGEELHVELAFDMSDFQWEHPLILGNDMPLGEALELLRQLCVEGESPDDIDAVQNGFRCLDIWKERAPEGTDAPQEDPAGEDTDA